VDLLQRFDNFAKWSLPNLLVAFAAFCATLAGLLLAAHQFWQANYHPPPSTSMLGDGARTLSDTLPWSTIIVSVIFGFLIIVVIAALLILLGLAWRILRSKAPTPLSTEPSPATAPSPTTPAATPPPAPGGPIAPPPSRGSAAPLPVWSPFRVLHLSDLHFSAKTAWGPGTLLGCLAADVAKLRAQVGEFHLVVVTGDIANFGTADEYTQATTWLTEHLAPSAGVTSRQVRVVPGNHDVHRASITRAASALATGLLGADDHSIGEVLSDPNERALLLDRQAAYLAFARTFHPGLTVPWWSERSTIQGLTVHLAGFNSALFSSSDDDGKNVTLSQWQCNELLAGAEAADLTIALLHHPFAYLHERDQQSEGAIRRRCGVILSGHLHQEEARIESAPAPDLLQLAAGASYAGSKWASVYQLIELDPMRGEAHVHFRVWDGHAWIPDRNRYQKAPDGVATLPLRRSPKAPALRAAEAQLVDPVSHDDRLELLDKLEELQISRARLERDKHDFEEIDKIDDDINKVVSRLTDTPPPQTGAIVAGAILEKRIASGAFGTVWRGRAPDGQVVAVKVFRPEQLKTHMAVWGFRRGVRAMEQFKKSRGPASLVRVLSVAKDQLALTMPFIDGATLEATDLTSWTLDRRLDFFKAICEAIQFAHAERVFHRDLKPANIMVDLTGAPVIIDFDTAHVNQNTFLSTALTVGTLGYMAPEMGKAVRPTVLMDVYSLGRILHFLLLGRHSQINIADAAIVRSELSAAPPALVGLVLHACSTSAMDRPASVAELLRELGVARVAPTGVGAEAQAVAEPPGEAQHAAMRHPNPVINGPLGESLTSKAVEAPSVNLGASQGGAPGVGLSARAVEAAPHGPPSPAAVRLPPPTAPQPSPAAEAPPPQPPPPSEAPRSSASVAEAVPDFTSSTLGFVAVNPVESERTSPGWGWRGLGALVVVLSVVGAWVKFGEEETAPVEPVAEVDPAPVIGPCELPALGGPTGETHKPNIKGLDMPFVGLSAGQFCMGSPDGVGFADEHPQHPVKVAGCLMGKSEVTQAQWRAVVKAAKAKKDVDAAGLNEDPSLFKGDKLPVESVSWCDVTRFANALSRLDGRAPVYEITDGCAVRWIDGANGYRLPTEAEWEYAARAGTTTAYATGDDEAALALAGWYGSYTDEGGNSGRKTHDVCTAPKQPWGLCDLHGNVWEWVFDAYDSGTYTQRATASTFDGSATLAETASGGAKRVVRGGCWNDRPGVARSARRFSFEPSFTNSRVGFRLLLCPPDPP